MATTADFRNGLCIKHNNDLWQIIEFQHVKPGKGPAFVRTKLKNLNNGRRLDNTFTAGVKIEIVRIENRKHQFLYAQGDTYHFMNSDNYEQVIVDRGLINAPQFLKEEGWLILENHFDQGEKIKQLFISNKFTSVEVVEDLSGIGRFTIGRYK